VKGDAPLPQVVQALDGSCFFLGGSERWQQQRGQEGDDGDDDEQFDQGESAARDFEILATLLSF
jgi:hypothetical protein